MDDELKEEFADDAHEKLTGTVLVVDDEEALRMIVQMSAQILGLRVLEAENGSKALELCRTESIDLIISDLMMPEMNGLDFLRNLRNEGFETKFIVVSGYGDSKKVAEAEKLGIFAFIDKPYEIPVFEEILTKAMEKEAS